MPLDLLPWNVLPGHLQGWSLCFGALPLTHRFTFQNTGSTSAYPGHYPRRLLLRASSSPAACGWHLLWKVMALAEGCWGLFRSPSPLVEPLGRRYPPGFVTVPTGSHRTDPSYPVPFWLQRVSLLRWFTITMA